MTRRSIDGGEKISYGYGYREKVQLIAAAPAAYFAVSHRHPNLLHTDPCVPTRTNTNTGLSLASEKDVSMSRSAKGKVVRDLLASKVLNPGSCIGDPRSGPSQLRSATLPKHQ